MTIRTHLADLREQREAYARLLETLAAGKLMSGDPAGDDARMEDLRRKIAELSTVIEAEESKRDM